MPRPLPFTSGEEVTLLCVGTSLDVLHARIPEPEAPSDALSRRDAAAVPRGRSLIVRTGISAELPVAGEWFELHAEKTWRFGGTPYAKGEVVRCRLDLDAVPMPPLIAHQRDTWSLEEWLESRGLERDDLEPEYEALVSGGARREVELQDTLVMPFTPLELEEDPILEAIAWRELGDGFHAEKILSEMTRQELRCLDAHAHLGHQAMHRAHAQPSWLRRAHRHYRVGVHLAERALGEDDVTSRGLLDNRPYLRCLHGLGLATWALGDMDEAARLFERLLRRDPDDGSGARFLLPAVREGVAYEAYDG